MPLGSLAPELFPLINHHPACCDVTDLTLIICSSSFLNPLHSKRRANVPTSISMASHTLLLRDAAQLPSQLPLNLLTLVVLMEVLKWSIRHPKEPPHYTASLKNELPQSN